MMDEHVFLGVVAVDEPVSGLDVEPFDGAGHFGGNHLLGFFWFLFDDVIGGGVVVDG